MKPTKISRRDFIQKSGMLLAASAVPSILQAGEKPSTLAMKRRKIQIDSDWDVIVVGGGPSGCTAAISAAREGAKTLLIEATGQLGGMGTTGMIPAWCPFSDGEKIIYRGLAEKVFRAPRRGAARTGRQAGLGVDQPRTVDDRLRRHGVRVGGQGALLLAPGRRRDGFGRHHPGHHRRQQNGLTAFKAKVFVDCTGDGDLAVWAGANYFMGNPDDKVQRSTLCFSIANVDSYGYNTNPNLYWETRTAPFTMH